MGAIKAEGIKNQLGRPTLDRFVILVREAAQNSWDAADPDREGPVRFAIDLRRLDEPTAGIWHDLLAENAPPAEYLPLRERLESPLSILFIGDRGTKGLGGPTRADAAREDKPHDYVSFLLNVGDPRDTPLGGGTYGFGKAVYFLASTAYTVLIHTRCRNENDLVESRLVGCALGAAFESDGHSFTGRHWFGFPVDSSDIVDPVRGDQADAIAAELGFPTFEGEELGTTIAVVAPDLDERTPDDVVSRLALAILWHLWPKTVDSGGGPSMRFSVALDDAPVAIPDPATHPVLREFVAAHRELDDLGETITYGAGAQPIGKVRLRTTYAPPPVIDAIGQDAGLHDSVHHCCLLRGPELVVEYRQGPRLPDDLLWYAGVFKAFPELDPVFARAEPPTHDAWSPENLDDRDRSLVRTTLRKIDEKLRSHAAPRATQTPGGGAEGLAGMSRLLGSLLAPAPGEAAGPRPSPKPGTRSPRTAVQMVGPPQWEQLDGRDVLVQAFDVTTSRQLTIDAETSVRVWGGAGKEADPPLGAADPELVAWRDPQGRTHPAGRLAIGADEGGRWAAIVASPADTATRIRVHEATADRHG
jgi:hypothetical protein